MADEEEYQVDERTGHLIDTKAKLLFDFWKGAKIYRCGQEWEGGGICKWGHDDPRQVRKHIAQFNHTYNGEPPKRPKKYVSPILDSGGNQMIREEPPEREIDEEFRDLKFREK